MRKLFKLRCHIAVNHYEMRLPAVFHTAMHHALCITSSPHNNGGSDELLRFVQSRAICDEETEFTVRLASDAENGYFLTCFASIAGPILRFG